MKKNLRKNQCVFLNFVLLFLFTIHLNANPDNTLVLNKNINEKYIIKKITLFEDRTNEIDISKIIHGGTINLKVRNIENMSLLMYPGITYWMRFNVKNDHLDHQYVLKLSQSITDYIDFYILYNNSIYRKIDSGVLREYKNRTYHVTEFIFDLPKNLPEYTVILKVKNSFKLSLPISIVSANNFIKQESRTMLLLGVYCGMILLLVIYNFSLFLYLRKKIYILYVCLGIFMCLNILTRSGITLQYFFPFKPVFYNYFYIIIASITLALYAIFTLFFLQVKKYSKVLFRLLIIIACLAVPYAFVYMYFNLKHINKVIGLSYIYPLLLLLICIFTSFFVFKKKEKAAVFYIIANAPMAIITLFFNLIKLNIVTSSFLFSHLFYIASVFEMIVFSLGVAYSIKRIDEKRIENQLLALELANKDEANKIKLLQKEMNPHFLFNTLDSIHYFIEEDQELAADTLITLSDNYRYLLTKISSSLITLEEEWIFTTNYLKIEKLIRNDTVQIELEKNENFNDVLIPPLTLQPVIENSMKHGFKNKRSSCFIRLQVERSDQDIIIEITDNGCGFNDSSNIFYGTLGNIRKRLLFYYPESIFDVQNREDEDGVIVQLILKGMVKNYL